MKWNIIRKQLTPLGTDKEMPMSITVYEKAVETLSELLEHNREAIEQANGNLDGFDADELADHLLTVKNSAEPDDEDITLSLVLVLEGKFNHWECPMCETQVYQIDLEDHEWSNFQAASGLQDFASYPGYGSAARDKRCDNCRMWKKGEAEYPPEDDDDN